MKSRSTLKLSASALAVAVACGMSTTAYANEDVLRMQDLPDHVVMPSITYNGWNYSLLDQITLANVSDLTMVWTLSLGIIDEYEAPPLVVGNVMYIIAPQDAAGLGPNEVLALDLTDEGRILWEFRPDVPDIAETRRVACCGDQTRGFHYAEGKLFMQTLDGQVFALDAGTGEALWRTQGVDLRVAETMTGTGGVFNGLYLTGNAGGEYGVRGKVAAYDINTGNLQYTMYNMGPDNEVGITPSYQAFYPDNQTSLATWYGDSWRRGGGTTWGYFTFDPEDDIFYYSTGNCGPWNPDYRREWGVINLDEQGGLIDYRNNWCASQMARDVNTGNLVWAYNITPADPWDIDEPLITPLITLDINGTMTKTAVKLARDGWFYVWDALTGEVVNNPWMAIYVDIVQGFNHETGRVTYDIDKWLFTHLEDRRNYTQIDPMRDALGANLPDNYTGTEVEYCPGTSARNWQNDAYSPRTGLLYTVVNTSCSRYRMIEGEYVPGQGWQLNQGAGNRPIHWFNQEIITFAAQIQANNPLANADNTYQWPNHPGTEATAWAITFQELTDAPIMATATDILFTGDTTTGRFIAIDATNGETAWAFRVGQSFQGSPITYIGPDGRQYVAVIGSGESTGNVDPADGPNFDERYWRAGSNLYVFALPQSVAGN